MCKEITLAYVSLNVAGTNVLYAMLDKFGRVNRLGSDLELYVGDTDPEIFEKVRSQIGPDLLHFSGKYFADPKPKGKQCILNIGLVIDGEETNMNFVYGSESSSPPPAVVKFLRDIQVATNPWWEEQKKLKESK